MEAPLGSCKPSARLAGMIPVIITQGRAFGWHLLGVSGRPGEVQQKKLLQELESTANSKVFALANQGRIIGNMLSSRVVPAWKYAHSDVTKHGFGMIRTKRTCKNSRFCLQRMRSSTLVHHITKTLLFLTIYDRGANSLSQRFGFKVSDLGLLMRFWIEGLGLCTADTVRG